MTLGGTIFLHQGQEIGAQNLTEDIPLHHYQDLATHRDINQTKASREATAGPGRDVDMSDVMRQVLLKARDHARVPMAWDGSKGGAGFTTGTPWMTLNSDYRDNNVAAQETEPDSVLKTWREMITFRKRYPQELVYGKFELVDAHHEQVFAYCRTTVDSDSRFLIALNWCHEHVKWTMPPPVAESRRKVLKAVGLIREEGTLIEMDPYACMCWQA